MGSMAFRIASQFAALMSAFSGAALAADADAWSRVERLEGSLSTIERRFESAQLFNRPPGDIDGESQSPSGDSTGLSIRIDRLERELRLLTGRVEEIQHDIQRLDEQARKTQQETGTRPSSAAGATSAPPSIAAPIMGAPTTQGGAPHRGDAFDPTRDPTAVGAPKPLGSTPPSAPLTGSAQPRTSTTTPSTISEPSPTLSRELGAPLDITHGRAAQDAAPAPPPIGASNAPETMAALPSPTGPKDEYEIAVSYLHKGQYETAEKTLAAFLAKNPKSRFTPGATFYLGESYFFRGRHREAAEKYLEISAKYASSPQAPDALLRLGQSLNALGAKEQACASFSEIGAKYPNAAAKIKEAVQRESKKVPC
jgi:tol-pal system protein YbgF